MNTDLSGWTVGKVTTLESTFNAASKFTGTGLDLWDTTSVTTLESTFYHATTINFDVSKWSVGEVTTMKNMFSNAKSLTSCNKRNIAEAWKSSDAFTKTTTYGTEWDSVVCADPCKGGFWSATGNIPCFDCDDSHICLTGVRTICTPTSNIECHVR
jgi:hypothetical protein